MGFKNKENWSKFSYDVTKCAQKNVNVVHERQKTSVTSVAQKYRALDWKTTTTPELQEHQQLMQKLQQQQVVLEDGHDGPASNPNHLLGHFVYSIQ